MKRKKIFIFFIASLIVVLLTLNFYIGKASNHAQWHMIDVNKRTQGDAHLILTNGVVTMIDGGKYAEAEKNVVPYLKKLNIKSIDHFFISHAHNDHYEGMNAINKGGIKIKNVYYRKPPKGTTDCCYNSKELALFVNDAEKRGAIIHTVGKGFKLENPNIEILYLHETTTVNNKRASVNDMSMIMKWIVKTDREYTALFTGDLNFRVGMFLSGNETFKADILKVPHHGGTGIAPEAFFQTVNADFLMYPSPKWVYTGLRGLQARKHAVDRKKPHCVNGINGTVVVNFNNEGVLINSDKESPYCKNGMKINFH